MEKYIIEENGKKIVALKSDIDKKMSEQKEKGVEVKEISTILCCYFYTEIGDEKTTYFIPPSILNEGIFEQIIEMKFSEYGENDCSFYDGKKYVLDQFDKENMKNGGKYFLNDPDYNEDHEIIRFFLEGLEEIDEEFYIEWTGF